MSYNGSGTFLINTAGQPVVSGTVISSTAFNALTADLATGLSTAITKDGQTTVTANIPMSTYKFTGLGAGSAATDSANLSQVQSTVTKLLTSVSGTDTITAVGAPVLSAYAAGQMFYFVATGDNTGAVTLNIDSLGAKAVTRDGSVALAAGDIKSGEVVVVVYDGTRFQVVSQLNSAGDARFANVSIASSLYVGGVATIVGNAGFSANVSITSALSVGGAATITGATTVGGALTLSGGTANGVLYLNGSKAATSGTALVFDGTNLGIGTSSPAYKLDVNGVSRCTIETRVKNSAGNISYLTFEENGNSSSATFISGDARTTGHIGLWTNSLERMRLDSSGNLGIGTTPSAWRSGARALQSGGNGYLALWEQSNGSTNLSFAAYESAANTFAYRTTGDAPTLYSQLSGAHLWFNAASGTANNTFSFTERMRLDSSGNLGIGTSSPSGRLHISTASGNTDFYHNVTGAGAAARTTYTRGGTIQFYAGLGAWSGTDTYQIASSTGPLTTLDSSGNLGIGTSSPGEKLEVNGAIKTAAPAGGTAASWKLGAVATVSPTSPNRTIEVDIGGTIYYIHAKTTNN